MNRFSSMMGSLNSFTGAHISTGVPGAANNTFMGGIGLHHSLNVSLDVPASPGVPGLNVGPMMGGSTGVPGLLSGTIMSSIGLHQTGNAGVPASSGASGLGIGPMMGVFIQDVLNGSDSNSAVAPGTVQTMLDIMDDMPGIHLVGLAHMNLFDSTVV